MLNFTWWVNRKDSQGRNIFQGGFLGLDNIGVFDRNSQMPDGGYLNQADATSWMAMYSLNLMRIALELALHNRVYEDIATKFFEHFLSIAKAMTNMAGKELGLWDEQDSFYYDVSLTFPDEHQREGFEGAFDRRLDTALRGRNLGAGNAGEASRLQPAPAMVSRLPPRFGRAGFPLA